MTALLTRISNGDDSAIAECLDAYGDMVWRLARRYLSRADGEVEDAVQEVFVELWLSAGRFDETRGSEPSFVATLAHRRLTDYQRRIVSRRRVVRNYENELTPDQGVDSASPAASSPKDERTDRAIEVLKSLPDTEREALWLWLYRGLTHREIGEATASPIGTVKSRVRRGLLSISRVVAGKTSEGGVV